MLLTLLELESDRLVALRILVRREDANDKVLRYIGVHGQLCAAGDRVYGVYDPKLQRYIETPASQRPAPRI